MRRYDEPQSDYSRVRDAPNTRRNEGRDVRRAVDPADRRTTLDRDYHMDDPMDIRMDPSRPEPRAANTSTRIMERPIRGVDPRGEREVVYRDPRTGELYREPPPPPSRRTPYENDFDDMVPASRPIIVSVPDPGHPRQSYNEYFLPGEGIEREVIQAEICRYLGQDATCRPGKNPQDGRSGFIIKAYRALTTEMIRSLQESSAKFRNEEKYWADKNRRTRRPEVSYTPIQDHSYDRDMDMDDDSHPYMPPSDRFNRDIDHRDPRVQMGNRQMPPVTTGYIPEPGYPAYSIASAHPNIPQVGFEPRSFAAGGNTTPPTTVRTTGFSAPDFPSRTTQQPSASIPAQAYVDPRTGKMVGSYSTHPTDSRTRR